MLQDVFSKIFKIKQKSKSFIKPHQTLTQVATLYKIPSNPNITAAL